MPKSEHTDDEFRILDLLNVVKKMPNNLDKFNKFSTLLTKIKKTKLMKEKFNDLLKIVEDVDTFKFKFEMYCHLILVIDETLLDQHYSQIQSLFSEILMRVMENEEIDRSNMVENLLDAIQGTRLIEENLSDLISAIKHLRASYPENKPLVFSHLLKVIEKTDLIETRFGDLLTVVENVRSTHKRCELFTKLTFSVKAERRDQLLRQYMARIKIFSSKILDGIENTSREEIRRIVLFKMILLIKKANLFDHFYSQIESIFSKILSEFIRRSNGYQRFFIDLVLSIKETNLIIDKFSELLIAIEKIEVSRFTLYDKIGIFSILLSSVKDMNLMEQFSSGIEKAISNILNTIENILEDHQKFSYFGALVVTTIGTQFISQIEPEFSNYLRKIEKLEDLDKFYGFYNLFGRIKTFKYQNLVKFKTVLFAIKGTSLMKKFYPRIGILFSEVKTVVENLPEDKRKYKLLDQITELVKDTELIQEFNSRTKN